MDDSNCSLNVRMGEKWGKEQILGIKRCEMKKIVFGVYHDINSEARSKEMLECLCKIGKVDFVSYVKPEGFDGVTSHIINKKSPLALFAFLREMKKTILKVSPDIVVLHDNTCSALIPFVKKHAPNAKLFYDSSELYIKDSTFKKRISLDNGLLIVIKVFLTSFRSRYEKKYLKDADVVFAANIERAEIMKDFFELKCTPIVFDNMHRIDDVYDSQACDNKFKVFSENGFNILFAGGIGTERKTFDYIKSFKTLGKGYNLIIAGAASNKALQQYDELVADCDNIHYIGFITRAELKYCMHKSQASVVIFDQDSYNTKYCASGKCFESLFEGVPILASENPPLKRICEENGVGVSCDSYAEAIKKLEENYSIYRKNVTKYIKELNYEGRLVRLVNILNGSCD
ncbi:MAG: glycosyltransferase family 4 protein [Ruminococcaceae bacterium]|nr:glycosyltransferase family 4 protein [Oscillospiraceae bacterium]